MSKNIIIVFTTYSSENATQGFAIVLFSGRFSLNLRPLAYI
jgi:hypothetical protein